MAIPKYVVRRDAETYTSLAFLYWASQSLRLPPGPYNVDKRCNEVKDTKKQTRDNFDAAHQIINVGTSKLPDTEKRATSSHCDALVSWI